MAAGLTLEKWLELKQRFCGLPWAWMHPDMKARIDAKAGSESPLTQIRIGEDKRLHDVKVSDIVPDGAVFTDPGHLGIAAVLVHCRYRADELTDELIDDLVDEIGRKVGV